MRADTSLLSKMTFSKSLSLNFFTNSVFNNIFRSYIFKRQNQLSCAAYITRLHNHFFKKEQCPELTSCYYFYKATCVIIREKLDSEIIFGYGVKGYFVKIVFSVKYPFNNLLIWRQNQLVRNLTVSYYKCTTLIFLCFWALVLISCESTTFSNLYRKKHKAFCCYGNIDPYFSIYE